MLTGLAVDYEVSNISNDEWTLTTLTTVGGGPTHSDPLSECEMASIQEDMLSFKRANTEKSQPTPPAFTCRLQ